MLLQALDLALTFTALMLSGGLLWFSHRLIDQLKKTHRELAEARSIANDALAIASYARALSPEAFKFRPPYARLNMRELLVELNDKWHAHIIAFDPTFKSNYNRAFTAEEVTPEPTPERYN